ncbi:MAG TPA: hypothetical protein VEC99_08155, partial [Clostridia bacterium]|nr:hypothetical protein [Clostridia bacterium]
MVRISIEIPGADASAWKLYLDARDRSSDTEPLDVESAQLEQTNGEASQITVTLPASFRIPAWALKGPQNTPTLSASHIRAQLQAVTVEEATRLKAELIDALRTVETVDMTWESGSFLLLKTNSNLEGEAKFHLSTFLLGTNPDLNPIAEFTLRMQNTGQAQYLAFGLTVVFRATGKPTFRIDLDDFNLSLPELKLPQWDLNVPIDHEIPEKGWTTRLVNRLSAAAGNAQITVTTDPAKPPRLITSFSAASGLRWAIAADTVQEADWNDRASLSPKLASIKVVVTADTATLTIDQLKAASLGNATVLEGTISGALGRKETGPRRTRLGPLEMVAEGLTYRVEAIDGAVGLAVVVSVEFEKLTIRLADDPQTFIVLQGKVELTPSASRVIRLEIIEPYPIELVKQAGSALVRSAQSIITVLGQFQGTDVGALQKLMEILGKFAAAIAKTAWYVGSAVTSAADAAARLVSKALAALADAVIEILRGFGSLQVSAGSTLNVEVRLALDPLEVRQVLITTRTNVPAPRNFNHAALHIELKDNWQPGLLLDFVDKPGAYLVATRADTASTNQFLSLETDLWLTSNAGTTRLPDADPQHGNRADKPLIKLEIDFDKDKATDVLVLIAGVSRSEPVLLQMAQSQLAQSGLNNVTFVNGPFHYAPLENGLDVNVIFQQDRLLPLLGMGETGERTSQDNWFIKKLKSSLGQVVWVKNTLTPLYFPSTSKEARHVAAGLVLGLKVAGLESEIRLDVKIGLDNLETRIAASDSFPLLSGRIEEAALGMVWIVEQKDDEERKQNKPVEMFHLSFANGETQLSLNHDKARMQVRFVGVSQDSAGIVFNVQTFTVGRSGVTLNADVAKSPVRLNGLDVPFQFTSGSLNIAASRLVNASISGRGTLPPALVGEADCTLVLNFRQEQSGIVLQSGKVEIDKKGEPIICHSTRFTLTVTDLDVGIQRDNGYHLYFLVTGSLRFTPKPGEFTSGLLGFLSDIEIDLERTPLAGDARVLAKHISFQKAFKPKKSFPLFNLFTFELRGFGYHPSSPKFEGSPAINLSGQIKFAEIGDAMKPSIDFHGLWIAPPKAGEALPRIKADGLGVDLQISGSVKIRGTVMAVDPDTRTVEGAQFAPPGYKTYGFLGEGELEIPGWGAMQASLGFLEVERVDQPGERKKAFFLYLQKDELAIEVPLPFWKFYAREVGYGLGFRYTLAGIQEAENAVSVAAFIKVMDELSKRQGDLARFSVWRADPSKDHFTLAMRAALQAYPAQVPYVKEREETAENPFFFDLMVAVRTDGTLLATTRGYLGVNYHDFRTNKDNLRERPGLHGYLYISAPRSELLARMVGESKGFIGERFPGLRTGEILRQAVQSVDWSATLYVRPGLFHYELGWPDQLVVRLVDNDKMKISLRGGMIFRATGDGVLWGYNIQADAWLQFGGSSGGSVGVEVYGSLQARFVARLLAWLSWQVQGSMVYGLVSLDASLAFKVRAWMEVDLGFDSFTIETSFSFEIQFTAAVELAITTQGVGARVQARIAINAFGCTLGVGVGFAFGDRQLDDARARVQRFLSMSLTAEEPPTPPLVAATTGDQRIEESAKQAEERTKVPEAPKVTADP